MAEIFNIGETAGPVDPKLDKIRKLLAKANADGVTEEEAAMYTAKAADLAGKWGIDTAVAAGRKSNPEEMVLKEYEVNEGYADMHSRLMYYVLEALGCKCLITSEGITAIGYLCDIERGELFYASLSMQMTSGAIRVAANLRKGWMLGFIETVAERLRDSEKRARREATQKTAGTELVLASRELAIRDAFKAEFPHTSKVGLRANMGAYGDGQAAGRSANMGGTAFGGGRTALAG